MKITKFNYPNVKQHFFKVVLDGTRCVVSSDVDVTSSWFSKLADRVDFLNGFHDLVHIEVHAESEVILQAIYSVGDDR